MKGKSELKEFLSVALELMSDGTIVDANVPMIMHKLQQVRMQQAETPCVLLCTIIVYLFMRLLSNRRRRTCAFRFNMC